MKKQIITADQLSSFYGDSLGSKTTNRQVTETPAQQGDTGLKGFSTGFAGGLIKSARNTAQAFQNIGNTALQPVKKALGLEDVETGIDSVSSKTDAGKRVDAVLAANTPSEKAGNAVETVTELALPTKIIGSVAARGVAKGATSAARGVQDVITSLPKAVETALNPTKIIPKENLVNIPFEKLTVQAESKMQKLDKYLKQAEKAVSDYSQPTPLEIAGTKAEEALNVLQNKLTKQGQLKQKALGETGNKLVKNISGFRAKLTDTIRDRIGVNIDRVTGELVDAKGRVSKISLDPKDNELVKKVYNQLNKLDKDATVRMVDDTVDAIQDLVYKRKQNLAEPMNTQVESVVKQITGQLNNAVKKVAGDSYKKANEKYSYFIDSYDKLNKALGIDATKGGSLMKRVFSPTDGGTKELFNQVKKLTGIDLTEEATFAKFVMENVGDARQASMLEELIKSGNASPRGLIGVAIEKILSKAQNPIGKAKRVIKDIPKK